MFDAVVLNEASLPFNSVEDCEKNIEFFFDLLHEAKNNNIQFSRVDDLEGNWNHLNYAHNFNFNQWLNAIEDRDRKLQIKSVISSLKCPLLDININKSNINVDDFLFLYDSNRDLTVLGLAFAHLNHSHSLSIASDSCWRQGSIPIVKVWYESDKEHEEKIDVPNISSVYQLQPFLTAFKSLRQQNRAYLSGLKVDGNEDFKNLLFTKSFLKAVTSSSLQPVDFRRLIIVLESLNLAIINSSNTVDLANNSSLTITGESESTMGNKSLVMLRRFKHPVLGNTIFEDHIKNFGNGKRLHILADYDDKTVCIGYFGNHLDT